PAYPQLIRQSNFHKTLSRLQLSFKDCRPEGIKDYIPERQIFIHMHFQLHAYFLLPPLLKTVVKKTVFARWLARSSSQACSAVFLSSKRPNTVGPLPLIMAFKAPCSFI